MANTKNVKMLVKQTIEYKSANGYFAGFIQNMINDTQIDGCVSQSDGKIELIVSTQDSKKLELFNGVLQKYLPHSIFLGDVTTEQLDGTITKSDFTSESYNIGPCNMCLELLSDPSSKYYLDENLKCKHYNNNADVEYRNYSIYSPHYSKGSSVLITNPNSIFDLFILTQDELKALYSIEKPTIKATIKDETLKNLTGKKYINIKAPYDNRSFLASLNAKDSGVNFLFFEDNDDLKAVVVQKNIAMIKANRVVSKLENLHEDSIINRFLNISKEASFIKGSIGANVSTQGINFLVSNEVGVKKVIRFQEFNLANVFEGFANDENRQRLIGNFKMKFPQIYKQLTSQKECNLFEALSIILELDELSFESVSDKSYEFRGNGGLNIDTHFNDDGFDFTAFIGSVISFKLAGVEMHYLAYSIFESLADMSIDVLNQLKKKFTIDKFVMMGDMFENSVLFSRILNKFQLSNPYFSQKFALS